MRRPQFTLKTLLWLMVAVAAACVTLKTKPTILRPLDKGVRFAVLIVAFSLIPAGCRLAAHVWKRL